MPEISVVIPLYNKERFIRRALDSVLSQTFDAFELIVVDDGSTDKSAHVVRDDGDPRIRLIQQENKGVSAARNRGILESRTDFIAFLDSDDEWLPCHLETLVHLRNTFPDAGLYSTATKMILPEGRMLSVENRAIPPSPWEGYLPSYFRAAAFYSSINSSSIAVPKRIFEKLGSFIEGIQLGEDTEMWGRIALKYPVAYSHRVGAVYHRGDDESATLQSQAIHLSKKRHPFINTAFRALKNGDVPVSMKGDLMKLVAVYETQAISHNVKVGELDQAKKLAREARIDVGIFEREYWYSMKWRVIASIPSPLFDIMEKIGLCRICH